MGFLFWQPARLDVIIHSRRIGMYYNILHTAGGEVGVEMGGVMFVLKSAVKAS